MFALALWDRKEKSLLIARDRYGVKPLYFFEDHKTVLFGSEQKPILEHAEFEQKINKRLYWNILPFRIFLRIKPYLRESSFCPRGITEF